MGYIFCEGVVDWHECCTCKNECGKMWKYEWLIHLKTCYLNQTKSDKKVTITQLVKKQLNNFYGYFLMDQNQNLHQVCQNFFCNVYKISGHTIFNYVNQSTV